MTTYTATPDTLTHEDGTVVHRGTDVLSWAYQHADAGSTILLRPGRYVPPSGILREMRPRTLVSVNDSDVWQFPKSADACLATLIGGGTDTLGFPYPDTYCHKTFRGFRIEGGLRSSIMYRMNPPDLAHFENHFFDHCWIDGGWNHAKQQGVESKWGVLGNMASGFVWSGGGVANIKWEHAFYFHNSGPQGVVIGGAQIHNCGRTALQSVARIGENGGLESLGPLRLTNLDIKNMGLSSYGHGGSAITVSGQKGRTVLENVRVGFDLAGGVGTGAVVFYPEFEAGNPGKPGTPNGDVIIKDCCFEFPAEFGDRPVVSVSAVERLWCGGTVIRSGRYPVAVALNPMGRGNAGFASDQFPLKQYLDGGGNQVVGRTMVGDVWMNG